MTYLTSHIHVSKPIVLLFILPLLSYIGAVLLLIPHITHAAGNTYHVYPGQSISQAAQQLGPGDTLIVHGGTYDEEVSCDSCNHIPGGSSWSNPVTIKAADGETAWVLGIGLWNPYIIVDGLKTDSKYYCDSNGCRSGIGIFASHIRIQNVEVAYVSDAGGIQASDGLDDLQFINLDVHHIGIKPDGTIACFDNNFRGYCHGTYFNNSTNVVFRGGSYHHNDGMGIHNGNEGQVVDGVTFYNNLTGIIFRYGGNNVVKNSIFYNNESRGIWAPGSGNKIYNNTFVGNGSEAILIWSGGQSDVQNNIFWNTGTPIADPGGSNISNNLTTNPNFVNEGSGDFHLQSSSPAIDAGTTLPEVPCDHDGNARPAGSAYDIGAYEYGSSPGGGCSGSTSSPTPAPTNQPPVITITATPNTLSVSGQGITLSWSVTNADSCTASGGWSGTKAIAGNTRLTPTVTTTYTLTCQGPGGGGQGSVTVPVGQSTSCAQYATSSSIPSGFGVPWDVMNPSIMLLTAQCTPPTVLLKAGDPTTAKTLYVYKTAYVALGGAPSWDPVDLFGSQLISQAWYPKLAQGVTTIQDQSKPTYYVAYTCTWTGTKWMCGCRDSSCNQSYWQVQKIQ